MTYRLSQVKDACAKFNIATQSASLVLFEIKSNDGISQKRHGM
jgi:hypothetical protein